MRVSHAVLMMLAMLCFSAAVFGQAQISTPRVDIDPQSLAEARKLIRQAMIATLNVPPDSNPANAQMRRIEDEAWDKVRPLYREDSARCWIAFERELLANQAAFVAKGYVLMTFSDCVGYAVSNTRFGQPALQSWLTNPRIHPSIKNDIWDNIVSTQSPVDWMDESILRSECARMLEDTTKFITVGMMEMIQGGKTQTWDVRVCDIAMAVLYRRYRWPELAPMAQGLGTDPQREAGLAVARKRLAGEAERSKLREQLWTALCDYRRYNLSPEEISQTVGLWRSMQGETPLVGTNDLQQVMDLFLSEVARHQAAGGKSPAEQARLLHELSGMIRDRLQTDDGPPDAPTDKQLANLAEARQWLIGCLTVSPTKFIRRIGDPHLMHTKGKEFERLAEWVSKQEFPVGKTETEPAHK